MAPWDPPDDTAIDAAQTPGTGTAPIRADLTNTVLKSLRDGISGLYGAILQAIATLSPAPNTFVWFNDALMAQLASVTAFARGFLGQPDAAGMRAYIGALSAGGAPAAHQASHQSGQGDALTGAVDANARVAVWYNGTPVAARRAVDLIEGSGVTMTPVDDAVNEVVRVTLNAGGGGGGGGGGTLADLSILPRHMVARETENLIPDPGLEVSAVVGPALVWVLSPANITLPVALTTAHPSSRYYLQFPGGKAVDYYAYTMPPPGIQVTAGDEYWAEFDHHVNTGTVPGASTLDMGMEFLALDGTTISRAVVGAAPGGTWVRASGAVAVPADAVYAVPFARRLANADSVHYRVTNMALRRRRGTNTTRDKAITYAKIQDVSATARLLGRSSAGAGVVEELTAALALAVLGLPAPAAGNALRALRVNGAGTAFEAVGFPSVFPAFYAGPGSASWLRSGHWTGTSGTQAVIANTIYYVPFLLLARYAPTKCAINVSTAAAGSCDVTFWNFDPATGKVGTTKYFSATLSTSATGNATGTIAPGTLEPGWYVYRLTFNAAPTLRAHATNTGTPWGFDPTGNNSPITMRTWASGAYTTNPASPEDIATNFADSVGSAALLVLQ